MDFANFVTNEILVVIHVKIFIEINTRKLEISLFLFTVSGVYSLSGRSKGYVYWFVDFIEVENNLISYIHTYLLYFSSGK
jgi:hypothetical protein